MSKYDIIIVGAGPAGIFTAVELLKNNSRKKIVIIEKGNSVEKRSCPKIKTKKCMNCKPNCMITSGFSGAGAFSDGKLSLAMKSAAIFLSLLVRITRRSLSTTRTEFILNSAQTLTLKVLVRTIKRRKSARRLFSQA